MNSCYHYSLSLNKSVHTWWSSRWRFCILKTHCQCFPHMGDNWAAGKGLCANHFSVHPHQITTHDLKTSGPPLWLCTRLLNNGIVKDLLALQRLLRQRGCVALSATFIYCFIFTTQQKRLFHPFKIKAWLNSKKAIYKHHKSKSYEAKIWTFTWFWQYYNKLRILSYVITWCVSVSLHP